MSPVAFVEPKKPDFNRIQELLSQSDLENHWSNFGPVWQRLKSFIEIRLELPTSRVAIPCASGTQALTAAAAIASRNPSREPWLVSAYGFRSTIIGPFADARIVDCDTAGMLSIEGAKDLDPSTFGGVVVTNPFGLCSDFSEYVRLARSLEKPLILDNAAGFDSIDRSDHAGIFECLSLHHTKPFGFGEGGCLIVDAEIEMRARAAINLGYGQFTPDSARYCSNGKLSEPAAAFILSRLESEKTWAPSYRRELVRLSRVASQMGIPQLQEPPHPTTSVYGQLALLANCDVTSDELRSEVVTLRKYYPPLSPDAPVANATYRRIVNLPVHPGMMSISDREIEELLQQFCGGAKTGARANLTLPLARQAPA
jgi:dTDP-4-amino-4,6-dideoxygalactose transaminase